MSQHPGGGARNQRLRVKLRIPVCNPRRFSQAIVSILRENRSFCDAPLAWSWRPMAPVIALAPVRVQKSSAFYRGYRAALNPRLISGTPPECLASLDDARVFRPGRQPRRLRCFSFSSVPPSSPALFSPLEQPRHRREPVGSVPASPRRARFPPLVTPRQLRAHCIPL